MIVVYFSRLHFRISSLAILLLLNALQFCASNQINAGGTGTSPYTNPDSIHFTPENLVFMLRQTYFNFALSPPQDDVDSITHATSDDDARKAYEVAIDKFVDDGQMRDRLREIGRQTFGMVSDKPPTRYPENLFAYVITNDLPISELLTATYAIDDDGAKVSSDIYDQNNNLVSPPVDKRAGYATYLVYLTTYQNTAEFKMDRELIGINLCDVAPYSKFDSFSWTINQVNSKYRIAEDGTSCFNCHAKKEPLRGAWQNYNANGHKWGQQGNNAQSNDQYGQELSDPSGATLEPRNANGTPMNTATAEATMYKFSATGPVIRDPAALVHEIIKQPRFGRCWTERMLAIFLNLDSGHPGQGFVPPNNFAASAAQISFLDKWTETFNQQRQIPKEWIRQFLKSSDYLILSYSPNSTNH